MKPLPALYARLLEEYGVQGWWPLPSHAGHSGFDARGYHPGDYSHPRTAVARFEVVAGAILTQNTAWTNAEMALARLHERKVRTPFDILAIEASALAAIIRASGYHNQKARKLREAARFFMKSGALTVRHPPSRETLLSTWGIGPETADSILLYAYRQPVFVVDAYTRRLFTRIGWIPPGAADDYIVRFVHRTLPIDHQVFGELHALVVEHSKRRCRAKPLCAGCPVPRCSYRISRAP
jgi:endonuclease-3 related protein